MVLNPLDAIQAQYSTADIPKAMNNVNLTRISITGGFVVVLCGCSYYKSQPVLTQCVHENENFVITANGLANTENTVSDSEITTLWKPTKSIHSAVPSISDFTFLGAAAGSPYIVFISTSGM